MECISFQCQILERYEEDAKDTICGVQVEHFKQPNNPTDHEF